MSDMLKGFVEKELEEQVQKKYPHIRYPAGLYAKVVQASDSGNGINICTIRILDENLSVDERFPEIPQVKTEIRIAKYDIIVVLLLYGSRVWVLGRRCE